MKRYGKYFTLDITYDKDKDGEYETDLTSIFEGELTPKDYVYYNGGVADFRGSKFN